MSINPSEFEDLRQRFEVLEKDYGRLCQNDSVMRKELSIAFKRLDKQAEEINILHGILNNICQSIREDKEKINTLMLQKDMDDKADDLFKQHGFKIEKGTAVIFDKSPTDEDFMKAQELINKQEE